MAGPGGGRAALLSAPVTLPPDHFDASFEQGADPWGYETDWYERRRHRLQLAALPAERYQRAFEPGCALGTFTALLAGRCDAVVAADMSDPAVARARAATAALAGVEVQRLQVPAEWPVGRFDLVVVADVGYYLRRREIDRLAGRIECCIDTGGHLLVAHWRGSGQDFLFKGSAGDLHARLGGRPGWRTVVHHEEEQLQLDVFEWQA